MWGALVCKGWHLEENAGNPEDMIRMPIERHS